MEDWVTIKNLKKKNPALSFRQIGDLLGISHNTVSSALKREELPQYKRVQKISKKLQPFEEVIFEMFNKHNYKGSRIYEEIKSKGYTGGKSIFYDHLHKIKITKQKSFTPYETAPGEQAQFDWSPYTVKIDGQLTKIYLYCYINSFSRYQILEVSLSENQGSVLEALENSIIQSKGVPLRIQTDNAKVFVKNASKNNFQWNQRYLHFCGHYGFEPSRSLPKHPWSKGKVERPFAFIEDHFITGASFSSFEELYLKLKDFQNKLNSRVHSTTKQQPKALFDKEETSLLPLPESRYVGVKEEIRKVSYDCLISFNGSRYSVPWQFAGKQVWIRVSKGYYLEAYSQANKLISRHKLSLKKGSVIIEQNHYRGNNLRGGNFQRLKNYFLEAFPDKVLFVEKLKAQKRINAQYQLHQIIELSKLYSREDFLAAIEAALYYNVFHSSFIAGYLENNFKHHFKVKTVKISADYQNHNIQRDMRDYKI
jgi:transposase